MEIKNRSEVEFIDDTCGKMQELYHSDSLSVAYVTVIGKARSHMHRRMEEVYYIESGFGKLFVDSACFDVKPGDIVPIPKNTYHHLEKVSEEPLEVLVITHPKYDTSDIIEDES